MLEAILAKGGAGPKNGLSKESGESLKDAEGGSFKDMFVKLVKEGKTQTKADPKEAAKDTDTKIQIDPKTAIKEQASEAKTLNSLLSSILHASGQDKAKTADLDTKTKMMQAKNVLEKSLGQKVELASLKDAKSLSELIKQANKKGLNAKIISFEQSQKADSTSQTLSARKNSDTVKYDGVKQALVQQAKTFDKAAQANASSDNTLSSVLARKLHEKGDQENSKPGLSALLRKEGETKETKNSSGQNSTLMQDLQKKQDKKDTKAGEKEQTLDKLLQAKTDEQKIRQKKAINDSIASKLDLSKDAQKGTQKAGTASDIMQSLQEIAGKDNSQSNSSQASSQSNATVNTQQGVQSEFSLKSSEAKQAVKQFASSMKEQVDNYKPPVSKLTLSLNPKSLGEVDVVIKTRGDQLSVQLSSQTAPALQVLAQNSQDLRQNLLNMGFENVSMQFSSNANKEGQSNAQQQARQMYDFDDLDELDEEMLANLEQIELSLPRYA